jgi:two-component system chemotaxis response regulator CheB
MPRSALEHVEADYKVPAIEIGPLLARLVQEEPGSETPVEKDESLEERIATEVQIAAGVAVSQKSILELGDLTPFTCPECQGTLVKIAEGKLSHFRCHTGHSFSEEALLEAVTESIQESLWQVTRGLQEAQMLLEHIGRHMLESGDAARVEKYLAKAHQFQKQASRFQEISLKQESVSKENLEETAG